MNQKMTEEELNETELNEAEIYFLQKSLDRETRESGRPGYALAWIVLIITLIWINK